MSTNKNNWIEVTTQKPCAYCTKSDWCSVSSDGSAAICRRTNKGSAQTKTDKAGANYYLYKVATDTAQTISNAPTPPTADVGFRHKTYSALLNELQLSAEHFDNLIKRGLSPEIIHRNGYRSLPKDSRETIAQKVVNQVGTKIIQVPGFYAKNPAKANSPIDISGQPGLLIPVRDNTGRITGLKVRADMTEKGRRYSSLSSRSKQGPGASAAIHFPNFTGQIETLLITEGELKADIATMHSGNLCISMPGVGMWRQALAAVENLNPKRIVIALDADHTTNPNVARPLVLLASSLMKYPVQLEMALWSAEHKGIDDALTSAAEIRYLSRDQLMEHLDVVLGELDLPPLDWKNPESSTLAIGVSGSTMKGEYNDDEWPDPIPLPEPLPIAPSLPTELIPVGFRASIADAAERMQVPTEYIAVPMVVAASIAIGRQLSIRPKRFDNWTIFSNLWGALIGRPSSLKSPAQSEALRSVKKIAAEALQAFKDQMLHWKATEALIIGQKKGIEEQIRALAKENANVAELAPLQDRLVELETQFEAEKPRARRYYTNDGTTEKIGEILQDNPTGLLVVRDELYGFLKSNDKPGREGDRAFYLESWNGYGAYTIDRVGRGTIVLPAVCLAILGGIQPGRLEEYVTEAVSGGSGDDGLLQRFQLIVWPEMSRTWSNVDRLPDDQAQLRVERIFRSLTNLQTEALGAQRPDPEDVPWLRFSDDAQQLFDQWLMELELRLRNEVGLTPAIEAHLGKYRKLMPALALIFHVVNSCENPEEQAGVSLEATQLAAAWCEFLEAHARKIYRLGESLPVAAAHDLLKRVRQKRVKDGTPIREIYRNHWKRLDTESCVSDALGVLEEYGWSRRQENNDTGGAPSQLIRLHPSLRDRGGRS